MKTKRLYYVCLHTTPACLGSCGDSKKERFGYFTNLIDAKKCLSEVRKRGLSKHQYAIIEFDWVKGGVINE